MRFDSKWFDMTIWKAITESAQGDETVSGAPRVVPPVVDVEATNDLVDAQSGQQQVDEVVRRDGAHVPLEPAQYQQLPLLQYQISKR